MAVSVNVPDLIRHVRENADAIRSDIMASEGENVPYQDVLAILDQLHELATVCEQLDRGLDAAMRAIYSITGG